MTPEDLQYTITIYMRALHLRHLTRVNNPWVITVCTEKTCHLLQDQMIICCTHVKVFDNLSHTRTHTDYSSDLATSAVQ